MRLLPAARVRGRFTLPGDKSLSHRLAILGAVAEGETRLSNFASAADCASTLGCLRALGVRIERDGASVLVHGRGFDGLTAPRAELDAGNSGSTLRMLAGVLAGRPFHSTLSGDASLRSRPVERVAAPLRAMGARLTSSDGGAPLHIEGASLTGLAWDLPVASAQLKTAILLAGLQATGQTTVREPAASRDHSERLLPLFGVPVERSALTASIRGGARLRGVQMAVPGDVSSAAFLIVAAIIRPGSEIRIEGALLNPCRTAFIDVLRQMGAQIEVEPMGGESEPFGTIVARSSRLHGVDVAAEIVPALIDEVPALAVAAAFAHGRFKLAGAAELRVKESDRIAALAEGLRAMGVRLEERADGLLIDGGRPLRGAAVRSHGDHRIAMSLAIAALGARGGTDLEGAECASVSFPEFFELLGSACR